MIIYDISNKFKEVEEWDKENSFYWIILHAEELYNLELLLDEECIVECMDFSQSAQIHYYNDYIFMVLNVLDLNKKDVISKELNIFLSHNFIVTVYKDRIAVLEEIIQDIKANKNCFSLKKKGRPEVVLYYILDRLIIRNYNIMSVVEEMADKAEIDILKSPRSNQIDTLVFLRRQTYKIRKILNPLRYIGDALIANENGIIDDEYIEYFKNINNKISKLMKVIETLVQDLAMVREAYEAEISNKTNDLMKVFTVVTTIFLPLELLTAIFSMGFNYMPFKDHPYSFFGILALMLAIAFGMLLYFKKHKMF
ncbi:magnesium transporter CorA family protein [Clostridium intestinale]|jgi:magnesium transporter|uniref:Magnesium and cobalt transport protein n=1 Tax=Clostridium intestinale URNW TaxID=1294142 RepID=U2N2J0_9CLOT|nr:magnesium transporter CorA family protein [Clostridium intestinale]ERK29727.1 magnesium and cobalt transport protein [Clostridium intestinale URNW]